MTDFRPAAEDEPPNPIDEAIVFLPATSAETLRLDERHLVVFRDCYPKPQALLSGDQAEGKNPREWYAGGPAEKPIADLERFGDGLNRFGLISLHADRTIPTLDLCIAILAWGGMHGSNRNHLFKRAITPWLDIAKCIRAGQLTRQKAFDAFAKLNHDRSLVGMGPAYYTKLIYFLMPREGAGPIGYIMDQWLGCSVNLIYQQEVVWMDNRLIWAHEGRGRARRIVRKAGSSVSHLNTGEHYERFCCAVEMLAARMGPGWTPDAAELSLMSSGGHQPEPWRAHVVRHRLLGLDTKTSVSAAA